VKAARTAWRRERDVEADKQIAEREAMRRQSLAKMVERQTESHWAQLKQFRDQRKYTQAMAEAKALLQLNPRNTEARKALYDLEIKAQMASQVAVRMSRESETVRSLVAVEDSATPYADIVRYPGDWEQLTLRRLRGLARDQQGYSAEAEQTRIQLHQRTDLDMTDVSLANVLTFLSESTKIPIVIDPHLQQDTGVDPAQAMVTLHARQHTLEQALRMILPEGTGYRVEDDHIVIASREKSNPLRLVSYPVQDIVAEIPDFGDSVPRFNLTSALNQTNQGGGGGAGGGLWEDVNKDEEKAGATGQKIIDMIKKFVTATDPRIAAWEDLGGTASIEYYNGFLLVTQTDAGHRKVREILSRL
jgi:hypothetical protein